MVGRGGAIRAVVVATGVWLVNPDPREIQFFGSTVQMIITRLTPHKLERESR